MEPFIYQTMHLIRTIPEFRAARAALPAPLGFVPTMGYLHAGHIALVRAARAENPSVAVSIFVNPAQFDRPDDLARYPRDLERDLAMLREEGVHLVFAPEASEIYPASHATKVRIEGLGDILEGAHRKGHFDGVATVVAKLFNIVQPDRAYFGQKDAQQLAVVRRMVADLNFPVQIIGVPTVREADGLALSSRNVFLKGEARQQALALSQVLNAARAAWQAGERDADALRAAANAIYEKAEGVQTEYLSLADPETLEELQGSIERGVMSTAAWVGGVRLIDNVILERVIEERNNKEAKRQRLIKFLKQPTPEMREKLTALKAESKMLERPDFIWYFLLQSFSTMGNSRGWYGLMNTPSNYNRVTFDALANFSPAGRLQLIETVLRDAKVRMPRQKAEWLNYNYERILQMGGLEEVRRHALSQLGTEAKVAFLKRFRGIGDKYARNIWMDVYHPDFHNTIAVDERIKRITEALGYSFQSYSEHERFYQELAREAGLQGWELDRLLYNYKDDVLKAINLIE